MSEWFDFRYPYFYKGEALLFEKAKVLDVIDEGNVNTYLLELKANNRKTYYGIFGAVYIGFSPVLVVKVGEYAIPIGQIVIYEKRNYAVKAFESLKSGKKHLYDLRTRHFKNKDLQWIAERLNDGECDDPVKFFEQMIETARSSGESQESVEKVVNGIVDFFNLIVDLNRKAGRSLYVVTLRMDSGREYKVSSFRDNVTDAIRKAINSVSGYTVVDKVHVVKRWNELEEVEWKSELLKLKDETLEELRKVGKLEEVVEKYKNWYKKYWEVLDDDLALIHAMIHNEFSIVKSAINEATAEERIKRKFEVAKSLIGKKAILTGGGMIANKFKIVEVIDAWEEEADEFWRRYRVKIRTDRYELDIYLKYYNLDHLPEELGDLPVGEYYHYGNKIESADGKISKTIVAEVAIP